MAAYAALVSLSNTLHHILNPPPLNNIIIPRSQISSLQEKVRFLIDFLESYSSRRSQEIAGLELQIVDAAYAAEDLIESSVVCQVRAVNMISTHLCEGIQTLQEKFLAIEKELMEMGDDLQPRSCASSKQPLLPGGNITTMVGFEEHVTQIMEALATDESSRQIIPIVGMGGIGKTTLASAVYNSPFIVQHFHVCGWVNISPEYNVRDLLLRLLYEINKEGPSKQASIDDDLGLQLHQELFGRKYLIVMDDMWNIQAYEMLKIYLPDDKNGSRILVTTRQSNLTVDFESCTPYKIDFLDEGKSWELLRATIFAREDCPVELGKIGKTIAKKCGGLPLALVVIGGLLAKSKRTREHWVSFARDLTFALDYGNDEHLMKILSLSYIHLPLYLKPCFLYLAMFPKDFEIRTSMLVRLWVAEGLIKPTQAKCLEEVAHEYLKDLLRRNLILVHRRGSSGKVKICKIHDTIRDLCIIQAEKEKLLYVVKLENPNIEAMRRLSISSSESMKVTALQSSKFTRSWLNCGKLVPGRPKSKVNQIIYGLGLLKVVHVNDPDIDFLKLCNIRCLVASSVSSIMSISLCWNLQTLVVEDIVSLPAEIWQMPQLRHLKIEVITHPDPPPDDPNFIVLDNLQTLKTVKNFKCTEQVLQRIPNLKKLRILYKLRPAASEETGNYCLKNLAYFKKLESLGIYGAEKLWIDIAFPISLKKLALWKCWIPWEDLSIVGMLPNLEVLKLNDDATEGEEWNPIEGEFRRLRFLLIRGSELKTWGAEKYHFSCLECLVLIDMILEEIPRSFAEILTLEMIELLRVDDCVWTSAREISYERELLGYEPLQLREIL